MKFRLRDFEKGANPKYIELNQKLQSLKPFNRNLPDDSVDDSNGGLPPPLSTIPPFTPATPLLLHPSVFNASFLPDVLQFEPKISQLQNEPTAKQQQQEHFSEIEAILKPQEEKPIMSNKLQSSFPDTDKIFQKMPAEIESKNETPISNLQTIAAELEIPRFYNTLVVVKVPNFEKNLKCLGWGGKWKNLLFH